MPVQSRFGLGRNVGFTYYRFRTSACAIAEESDLQRACAVVPVATRRAERRAQHRQPHLGPRPEGSCRGWDEHRTLHGVQVASVQEAMRAAGEEGKKEAARAQKRLDDQTAELSKIRMQTEAVKSKQFLAGQEAKEREKAAAASVTDAHKAMQEMEATQGKVTAAKDQTIAELRQDVLAADESRDAVARYESAPGT
jgi:hypothetical protein